MMAQLTALDRRTRPGQLARRDYAVTCRHGSTDGGSLLGSPPPTPLEDKLIRAMLVEHDAAHACACTDTLWRTRGGRRVGVKRQASTSTTGRPGRPRSRAEVFANFRRQGFS